MNTYPSTYPIIQSTNHAEHIMRTINLHSSDSKAFATAIANAAQDHNEEYQFIGTIQGRIIHLTGLGYHLSMFLIDGADYATLPDQLNTRSAFKAYIVNSIQGA